MTCGKEDSLRTIPPRIEQTYDVILRSHNSTETRRTQYTLRMSLLTERHQITASQGHNAHMVCMGSHHTAGNVHKSYSSMYSNCNSVNPIRFQRQMRSWRYCADQKPFPLYHSPLLTSIQLLGTKFSYTRSGNRITLNLSVGSAAFARFMILPTRENVNLSCDKAFFAGSFLTPQNQLMLLGQSRSLRQAAESSTES